MHAHIVAATTQVTAFCMNGGSRELFHQRKVALRKVAMAAFGFMVVLCINRPLHSLRE